MTVAGKALISAALAVSMQGQTLLNTLTGIPAQAAGQTVAQYMAAEGIAQTATLSNGATIAYDVLASGSQATAAVSSGTTAAQAAAAWSGASSATGAASQVAVESIAPQVAMQQAGASSVTVGGLLTMSLPAWTAAVAPLLGVGLGYGLYETNPEFWEKVSRKLLPFAYEDSSAMPAYTDKDGQVYVDKDAADALKELFQEEGVPITGDPTEPQATSSLIEGSINVGNGRASYGPAFIEGGTASATINGPNRMVSASASPFVGHNQQGDPLQPSPYTYDGKTAYIISATATPFTPISPTPSTVTPTDAGPIGWSIIYGDITPVGEYPEGTEKWEGDTVDFDNLPTSEVVSNPTDTAPRKTVIPIQLPTDPTKSNDPTENPNPIAQTAPDVITKYIAPYTAEQNPDYKAPYDEERKIQISEDAPISWPVPDLAPTKPIGGDPSQPLKPPVTTLPDIVPLIPLSTGDSGSSPNPLPDPPFSSTAGLITVYNPTATELISFAHWLWVTYADATIDKIWNNPFDGIIGLHELYATPSIGTRMNIRSGFLVSDTVANSVPDRYTEINCGSAVIPEYYGNYLDYSPYSKAYIYLPFIGIQEVSVDDIVGHAVNITYRVDSYNGSCIALVTVAKMGYSNTVYQFNGNCSVELPIAGGSQASIKAGYMMAAAQQQAAAIAGNAAMKAGVASAIGNGVGSLLGGHIGGAISGAVSPVASGMATAKQQEAYANANALQSVVTAKSSVQHSGSFGASYGAMGFKKPYIIIQSPIQVKVTNYNLEYGFPAHKYVRVGDCEGFLRVREVHVESSTATDDEKALIEQMLKSGVYVT